MVCSPALIAYHNWRLRRKSADEAGTSPLTWRNRSTARNSATRPFSEPGARSLSTSASRNPVTWLPVSSTPPSSPTRCRQRSCSSPRQVRRGAAARQEPARRAGAQHRAAVLVHGPHARAPVRGYHRVLDIPGGTLATGVSEPPTSENKARPMCSPSAPMARTMAHTLNAQLCTLLGGQARSYVVFRPRPPCWRTSPCCRRARRLRRTVSADSWVCVASSEAVRGTPARRP